MPEDLDPVGTREWLDALDSAFVFDGPDRVGFLLGELMQEARRRGAPVPYSADTAYLNTIPPERETPHPGDQEVEHRIRSLIRWNAVATVLRANKESSELGGHIASFQSAATLYDVGFNHFWHAPNGSHGGDLLFVQGHCAPGIYARAFVEGRISEEQLRNFRQEVDGGGLSSYPHPWLMPEFWQFPTVSMGLGPLMAIYQARFLKYLHAREFADTANRHVWAFLGDGEMDEPESLGAISLAGREKLDNLIFVINCNLQRLDGPVRGNGKIIQELEGVFRGAGWNVIKVIWGSGWDPLIAADKTGLLLKRMEECVDGALAHVQDDLDAGEVDAEIAGEREDRLEPLEILVRVESRVAFRARRLEQPLALVEPQRLRVDVVALRHHADHVVGLAASLHSHGGHPFRSSAHVLRIRQRQLPHQRARPLIVERREHERARWPRDRPAARPRRGQAALAHPELPARLRARRHAQPARAGRRRHVDARAERRFVDRQRHVDVQVVALAPEARMRRRRAP